MTLFELSVLFFEVCMLIWMWYLSFTLAMMNQKMNFLMKEDFQDHISEVITKMQKEDEKEYTDITL